MLPNNKVFEMPSPLGPLLPLAAACSSSLVSLHMAFNSLLLGNMERAANSGANLMLSGGGQLANHTYQPPAAPA